MGMVHFTPDKAEKLVDKLGHTCGRRAQRFYCRERQIMDNTQLMTRSIVRRVPDGFQPIQRFAPVVGVDFDASILVGTHRLIAAPALAALEWMHIEPQTEQIQPGLSRLATLKATLDRQVRTQDAVDCFSGTTGAHHSFQDVEQCLGQYGHRFKLCA
jgi:hypothetical protein